MMPSQQAPDELLLVEGIRKTFDGNTILDIAHLSILNANAYVLTGMNGAGKTILLRILAGLEKAQIGSWKFSGREQDLHPYPRCMRDAIVYVHQHPVMFHMNVADNIAYGLRARGLCKTLIDERTEQALQWAGLVALRDRMPQGLSGGEKQKIALARAKILEPRLLLLDEPSANLDGHAREQVMALIPTLVAQNTSVMMVCHDRDLIHLPQVQHWKLRDGKLEEREQKIVEQQGEKE
jgi:tungstate transport system ATP-binding protein